MDLAKFLDLIGKGTTKALSDVGDIIAKMNSEKGVHSHWIDRATDAVDKGFYLEAVVICVNLINSMLRQAIFINSISKNAEKYGILFVDSYLHSLLTSYENYLLGKIDDRRLYKEALDLNVIDKKIEGSLNSVYDERNELLHRLFLKSDTSPQAKSLEKELAIKYVKATSECLASQLKVNQHFQDLVGELSKQMGKQN